VNRTEKQQQVEQLQDSFGAAQHAFLVDFQGLTVALDTEFRNRLRAADARYRVVKNRLARRALEQGGFAALDEHFRGPTGVALSSGDPVQLAKVLVDFAKDHPALKIKVGLLEGGQGLAPAQVEALSKLPGLPELRAQILSMILAPATRLARLLAEPGRGIARALDARRGQMENG